MREPKALLHFDGASLVEHHIAAMRARGLAVRVATGAHAERIGGLAAAAGATLHRNRQWLQTGPMHSLRICVADLPDATPLLVTPVDVPPAPAAVIAALLACDGPAVPSVSGRDGHPIRTTVGVIRKSDLGHTLRDALHGAVRIAVDWPGALRNLNTPDDFRAWRADVATSG